MKRVVCLLAALCLLVTATVAAPPSAQAGGDDPIKIVIRAFMPAEAFWFPNMYPVLGDNREFANNEPASSRLSITLLISPVDGSLVEPPTITAQPLVELFSDQTQHTPDKPFWWQELIYEDPIRSIHNLNWKQYVTFHNFSNGVWIDVDHMPIDPDMVMTGLDARLQFEVGPNADGEHTLFIEGGYDAFPSWEVWVDGEPIVLFDAGTLGPFSSTLWEYHTVDREIPLPEPPVIDPVDDTGNGSNNGGNGSNNGGNGFRPDPGPGDDIDGHTFDDVGSTDEGNHGSNGSGGFTNGTGGNGVIQVTCGDEDPFYLEATIDNILAFIDDCLIVHVT